MIFDYILNFVFGRPVTALFMKVANVDQEFGIIGVAMLFVALVSVFLLLSSTFFIILKEKIGIVGLIMLRTACLWAMFIVLWGIGFCILTFILHIFFNVLGKL